MREEDKPFVCYKQDWSIKIVPRGGAGWRAFGLWMAGLGALLLGFFAIMTAVQDPGVQTALAIGFVLVSLIWAVAMIRWMMARSEVVDLAELMDLKRKSSGRPGARRDR